MLGKSSKWEQGFVHYIGKFTTILRFIISRFGCTLQFLVENKTITVIPWLARIFETAKTNFHNTILYLENIKKYSAMKIFYLKNKTKRKSLNWLLGITNEAIIPL